MNSLRLFLALILCMSTATAQTLNESFNNTKPLTDAEQYDADHYIHAGKTKSILESECKKIGQQYDASNNACTDVGVGGVLGKGATGEMLEMMLPKLYGLMGTLAMTGNGPKIKMKEAGEDGKDEKDDVCVYIPMAGEVVASGMQMMGEKQIASQSINKPGADMQKEGLYAVARTHDTRAKTATIQGSVYAATGACYVAYIATGAVVNAKMALKLGAAATMSYIFFAKASKEKKFAASVRDIAKKLPGAGDCNPITATNCFCSEKTSQQSDFANWSKVCVPKGLAAKDKKSTPIPCSTLQNGKATLDAECKCKKNNSCLNGQMALLGNNVGFGGTELADPLRMLDSLNGSMDDADVENFGAKLNAKSNAFLKNNPVGDIPSVSLSDKDKNIAKELAKIGMPGAMAAFAASQSGAGAPVSASAPSLVGSTESESDDYNSGNKRTSYSNGGSFNSSSRGRGSNNFNNPFGKNEKKDNVQVDMFAEQALAAAEISKDTSVGIFDLISNRYRRSAWSRFEMDKLVQEVPAEATKEVPAPAPAAQ
ncbi:MAG: hypothetical protein K2P81_02170 [Bacteriovoracaceae bacterium]|nr:hypothetical protein [Bacteriovoracaceae bacterium]